VADESIGVLLLAHVRDVFDERDVDRITTDALLAALVERDDGPWGDWWGNDVEADRTKGPASRLAKLLKPHDVTPKKLRLGDGTARGYERVAFATAWEHYLPPEDGTDGTPQVTGHIEDGTPGDPVPSSIPGLTSNVPSVPSSGQGGAPGRLLDDPEWAAAAATLAGAEPGELFDGDDHRDPGRHVR
jgi:hypothetical protein